MTINIYEASLGVVLRPAARGFAVWLQCRFGGSACTHAGSSLETKGESYGKKQNVRDGLF